RGECCGVLDFTCAWSAQVGRALRITRKTLSVRCSGKDCRRWFGLGLVFLVLPRAGIGGSIPPEDDLIPSPPDPLLTAKLNAWRRGDPTHQTGRLKGDSKKKKGSAPYCCELDLIGGYAGGFRS